jgi:hypothetical protein
MTTRRQKPLNDLLVEAGRRLERVQERLSEGEQIDPAFLRDSLAECERIIESIRAISP